MKALLLNCSPHINGSTNRALQEIAVVLKQENIACEFYQIPLEPLQSCMGCGSCRDLEEKCIIEDCVNEILTKMKSADALVVGSPVHFAGISGAGKIVLDRMFYCNRSAFKGKVFAGVVIARRAGTTAALEQLNKYPLIANMYLVGSQYWQMVFGHNAKELEEDKEGLQNMRTLAANLAWLTKLLSENKRPEKTPESPQRTNFIR